MGFMLHKSKRGLFDTRQRRAKKPRCKSGIDTCGFPTIALVSLRYRSLERVVFRQPKALADLLSGDPGEPHRGSNAEES